MITDLTLDAWKRWLEYSIFRSMDGTLAGIPIQMRDSEELKTYPGIYIEADTTSRVESGGVQDGNVFAVEWLTKLVTTPGDDAQVATSKESHDQLRNTLSASIGDLEAEAWIDSQIGIRCFQLLTSAPETSEEDGYRVTGWKITGTICEK